MLQKVANLNLILILINLVLFNVLYNTVREFKILEKYSQADWFIVFALNPTNVFSKLLDAVYFFERGDEF